MSCEVTPYRERAGKVCKPSEDDAIDLQSVAKSMLATYVAPILLGLKVVLICLLRREVVRTLAELAH
jgi:hypothetical protein